MEVDRSDLICWQAAIAWTGVEVVWGLEALKPFDHGQHFFEASTLVHDWNPCRRIPATKMCEEYVQEAPDHPSTMKTL